MINVWRRSKMKTFALIVLLFSLWFMVGCGNDDIDGIEYTPMWTADEHVEKEMMVIPEPLTVITFSIGAVALLSNVRRKK
jgi:hypothetical protein